MSTITLAPGEKRKYTKKEVLKRSRKQKETEKYASTIADERAFTSRVTSDIMDKANTTTNFSQNLNIHLNGGLGSLFNYDTNSTTNFKRDQFAESQRVKKSFHEAVRKSSQEYKNERSLEVNLEETDEFESSFNNEISNPNNEITVTYLFYELERQYRITEHLNKITPIILVAQKVPAPHEIDEDWILTHEWILRRALLDASFHSALDYIAEGLISDEAALEVKRENYQTQKALVEDLTDTVASLSSLQETMRETLIQTSEREKIAGVQKKRRKRRKRRRIARRFLTPFKNLNISANIAAGDSSLTFGDKNDDPAALEARREALETRLGFLEGNLEDAKSQLTGANSALEQATAELTEAVQESFTRRNLVTQLKIHIKENILHYMQSIWSFENPHQRFMRLYDLPVDIPFPDGGVESPSSTDFTFSPIPEDLLDGIYRTRFGDNIIGDPMGIEVHWPVTDTIGSDGNPERNVDVDWKQTRLHQIADIDKLLGFKGNYMIFPLKECTFITNYMMQDYVDEYLGARDPDPAENFSTDELLAYAEQVWHAEDTTDDMRQALENLILGRLTSAKVEDELIVVPTGQLFIEALKGTHTLLEPFKLEHRRQDVLKVKEEVREAQLENLRKAMRLIKEEPLLDDPDVDKRIEVQGNDDITIAE